MARDRLPFPERRMLDEAHAADYLGLPGAVFKRECPVQAVRIGRHVRWDRYALDSWVDSFSKTEFEMSGEDWLAVFEAAKTQPQTEASRVRRRGPDRARHCP